MVAATAMWGVSFVAPLMLDRYSPIQITFGRFFFYGIVSVVIWLSRYRHTRLSPRAWALAMAYGLAGNVLFSILVSFGIQDTGAEVCIPIIGLLPICVSVFGNYRLAEAPWRQMILPLTLIIVG